MKAKKLKIDSINLDVFSAEILILSIVNTIAM